MNIEIVLREINSAALRETTKTLNEIIERVQSKEIEYQQGNIEITGCKHIIQSVALDWTFNNKKSKIPLLKKN